MGVVLMSKRELNRIDVLARLDGRGLTASAAADLMRVTLRQTHRLLKRYRDGGAPAIANRLRGRPSNNRLSDVVREITPSRWERHEASAILPASCNRSGTDSRRAPFALFQAPWLRPRWTKRQSLSLRRRI